MSKNENIKAITLTKAIQSLTEKDILSNNTLTENGKKMVHYLEFRNETINLFLKKYKIIENENIINQMSKLDYKIIIALRNLI